MKYSALLLSVLLLAEQSQAHKLTTIFRPPVYDQPPPAKEAKPEPDQDMAQTMESLQESEGELHQRMAEIKKEKMMKEVTSAQSHALNSAEQRDQKETMDSLAEAEKELNHKLSAPIKDTNTSAQKRYAEE